MWLTCDSSEVKAKDVPKEPISGSILQGFGQHAAKSPQMCGRADLISYIMWEQIKVMLTLCCATEVGVKVTLARMHDAQKNVKGNRDRECRR